MAKEEEQARQVGTAKRASSKPSGAKRATGGNGSPQKGGARARAVPTTGDAREDSVSTDAKPAKSDASSAVEAEKPTHPPKASVESAGAVASLSGKPKKAGKRNGKKSPKPNASAKAVPSATPKSQEPSSAPRSVTADDKSVSPKKDAEEKPKKKKGRRKHNPITLRGVLMGIVPIICLGAAFAAMVGLYRMAFRPDTTAQSEEVAATAPVTDQSAAGGNQLTGEYQGIEDPWTPTRLFTTTDKDLDLKIKAFCDGLSTEGATARENAQNVYNSIMWSYVFEANQNKPAGPTWVLACAREFFSTVDSASSFGGSGDYYQFAAAICYCLRYFGFSDAQAIPVVVTSGDQAIYDVAYCLVTDVNGASCVCDPTIGTEGWMLDRYTYNIVVDDIGQDLTQVEALGLPILRSDESDQAKTTNGESQASGENQSEELGASQTQDDEVTYDEQYGDQGWGYDMEWGYDTTWE